MKLFEIGDGLKSIKVGSKYYSDWENADNVIIYSDDDLDEATIRISVISVEPKDKSDLYAVFEKVISNAKSAGYPFHTKDDKSFYSYSEDSTPEDGPALTVFFYEIGYKWDYIIISLTTDTTKKDTSVIRDTLDEIEGWIASIEEISLDSTTLFEPKYTDFKQIDKRIAEVFGIAEESIEEYHKKGKTIESIQQILDDKKYGASHTSALQSLGIAMGDYIQYKYPDFRWGIARDEYGRDLCLQYKNKAIHIFPMTMISKRIEDGEDINVSGLICGLLEKIEELNSRGDYSDLDHNY